MQRRQREGLRAASVVAFAVLAAMVLLASSQVLTSLADGGGFAGIRGSAINRQGAIVKEAIERSGSHSYHIINHNSPGATGAPAIAAYLVDRLAARGDLDHLTPNPKSATMDWDVVAEAMQFAV